MLERTEASRQVDLSKAFRMYQAQFGAGDVGLMLVGMHLELCDRVAELRERIAELESKRK